MERTVLVAGEVTMDALLNVPYAPNGGRIVHSKENYDFTPGGGGAYTAVAAQRTGVDAVLCAAVGNDEFGRQIVARLKEEGVNTSKMTKLEGYQTALSVYLLEQYGLGGKVVYNGANAALTESDIEEGFLSCPDVFTTSLRLDKKLLLYAAELTREKRKPFVLDATGVYENYRLSDIVGVDILIINESEAELLTGIKTNGTDNLMRICISICEKMPVSFIVLRLGLRGAYIYDGKYCELLMSPPASDVDGTAVQESFVGAFCAHFADDHDVYNATRYALAAASFTASHIGGFASIPNDEMIKTIPDND